MARLNHLESAIRFKPQPFLENNSLGLLSLLGSVYKRWAQQEMVKKYAQGEGLRDVIVGGLPGMGKSTFINEMAEHWAGVMGQESKFYLLATGNGIKLGRDWGLITNPLGKMNHREYRVMDMALSVLNSLAHEHLDGNGWVMNEFVMVTGLPNSKDEIMGITRGTTVAKKIIDRNPRTSLLLMHGDLSLPKDTMAYRNEISQAGTASQAEEVNQKYGVIDPRPWTEIVTYYKQTGNLAALDQGHRELRSLLYKLGKQGLIEIKPFKSEREFNSYLDSNPDLEQTLVIGEYFPLLVDRLYSGTRQGEDFFQGVLMEAANNSRSLIFRNRRITESRLTRSPKVVGVVEALIKKAKRTKEEKLCQDLVAYRLISATDLE